jgi:hypothetical protein
MSYPFLTDAEILEVVAPLKQPAAIVRWFLKNGFIGVKVRPNGMPLITRAHFDAVTVGGQPSRQDQQPEGEQPNVPAYLERLEKRSKSARRVV